jgi:hypothetical protein
MTAIVRSVTILPGVTGVMFVWRVAARPVQQAWKNSQGAN